MVSQVFFKNNDAMPSGPGPLVGSSAFNLYGNYISFHLNTRKNIHIHTISGKVWLKHLKYFCLFFCGFIGFMWISIKNSIESENSKSREREI